MEELAELNIDSPLKERIEFATPYKDVSRFRKLKILTLSDTILQVNVEFSEDGNGLGSSNLYRIASGVWKCEEVITQMTYMRIRVVNQSGKINERLVIKVTPVKLNEIYRAPEQSIAPKSASLEALPDSPSVASASVASVQQAAHLAAVPELVKIDPVIDSSADQAAEHSGAESVEEKKKRFKSPFSLRRSSTKVKNVRDYRIPELVPRGCLLIGGNNGSIQALPLGNPGEILMINEQGIPEWVKLSLPQYKPLPSLPAPSSLPPPLAKSNSSGTASQPSVAFDIKQ
jgi:hypothetical protein